MVLLEAPVDILAARLRGRELDRFERAGAEFHYRVADGYRAMAAADPDRWVVVDAAADPDEVARQVLAQVAVKGVV